MRRPVSRQGVSQCASSLWTEGHVRASFHAGSTMTRLGNVRTSPTEAVRETRTGESGLSPVESSKTWCQVHEPGGLSELLQSQETNPGGKQSVPAEHPAWHLL